MALQIFPTLTVTAQPSGACQKICVDNYVTNAHFLSFNVILPIPRPRAGGRRQNL